MEKGVLDNYWTKSGSERYARNYLAEKSSFLEDYSGLKVSRSFAEYPGEVDDVSAEGYLYQAGFLTLRKDDDDKLSLDYPNGEVRKSMAKLSVLAMMDGSVDDVEPFFINLSKCLRSGEPKELFNHFREVLSGFSYQALCYAANQYDDFADLAPFDEPQKKEPGEWIYRKFLQKYLGGAGVLVKREETGNLGPYGLAARFQDKTYVIDLKMAGDKGALEAAQAGLDQLGKGNCAGSYKDLILISLGLDAGQRNAAAGVFAIGDQAGRVQEVRLIAGQGGEIIVMSQAEKTKTPGPAS
jgi:hypothetical protein